MEKKGTSPKSKKLSRSGFSVTRKSTSAKSLKTETNNQKGEKPFPVVGIGASAGGLEAFSDLLAHLPANLGMAYVFIQHLSAHHESMLPDLLRRKTSMKVIVIRNNMLPEKDVIHVCPRKRHKDHKEKV